MPHVNRRINMFLIVMVAAIFLLSVAFILLMTRPARADPKLPNGLTCEVVRDIVAQVGRVRALALAIENGATWAQIREAKKCLK